ncbi:LuxR C-terminal-related transcriptional regulator [Pseudomonas sp. Gutcm_11s]|uniref:LuxR C-terminal-related transcriptional regulator n=1 Tax=Pseudomonas sp. Gutcm_11s TaxID=3026088 RepID=UPI0023608163|nr:response regulator transcription factor [Pseudomonas sp. Gutcm_11s]MDD0843065.1 response regulator transcription factor [Pseudomonas sp. Gutcm_11s]
MIGVVLVEDDPLFRETVRDALAQVSDIALTAEAVTLSAGLELLSGPAAQVLLVDLGLPDGSGINMIRAARQAWPDCAIMVATLFGDEERVFASLEAGASGYLLKDALASGIVDDIRNLHAGGSPISPLIARRLLRHFQPPATLRSVPDIELSVRERQVLELITRGYSVAEIAEHLQVSPWTVQTYVRRVYEKLGVRSKAAAVSAAHRLGLLDAGDSA